MRLFVRRAHEERMSGPFPVVAVMSASVLAAMALVLDGHRTWRDAGSDIGELLPRSIGVPQDLARTPAQTELPPLPT